jgi:hypothetical protein
VGTEGITKMSDERKVAHFMDVVEIGISSRYSKF